MRTLTLIVLVSIAAAGSAHGQVPTAADFDACNDEAPAVARAGGASPTTGDHARAKGARAGTTTGPGCEGPRLSSRLSQLHATQGVLGRASLPVGTPP